MTAPFFNIESDYFSFNDNSFMSGNSFVLIKEDKFNKFLAKGVSVEWSKVDGVLSMIKGDLDFFLPLTQVYLNFDLAILSPFDKLISFSNSPNDKETSLVLRNDFRCTATNFFYNFQSDESHFSWSNPFYFEKNIITPKDDLLELNAFGFLKPFIAKKILKKKLGQNKILKNKLVSFGKDMGTFSIQ